MIEEILTENFNKKKDVLCLMVEIGKILEANKNNEYPTLSFYRNWCVHSKINDLKNYKKFFIEIDKEIKKYLKQPNTKSRHWINKKIENFFSDNPFFFSTLPYQYRTSSTPFLLR